MPYTEQGIGYRNTDTSLQAANEIAPKAKNLKEQVLELLRRSPDPLDTEEIAATLGARLSSVQPRTSELSREGKIRDSGFRGVTEAGKPCIRWVVV